MPDLASEEEADSPNALLPEDFDQLFAVGIR